MIDAKKIENELNPIWKSFVQTLSSCLGVRHIQKPIDEKLIQNLKDSYFFKNKIDKIRKMNAKREKEWAEARRLELEMEAFFENKVDFSQSKLLTSVSHTNQDPLVIINSVLVPSDLKNIQGVGVDMEYLNRPISLDVTTRFLSPKEMGKWTELKPIDLWVLKEAAFKATPPDLQLIVTQYSLQNWNSNFMEGEMISKNVRCPVKLVRSSGLVFGFAYYRY